ncbi:RteC domain-containing protein [Carboxylicivirga sp. RSCT41]|uniref:RteC domain-containing protein n=1 Tax=Carboxylicivirga agarovorans TaxID=3417570 RepID=UPI003D32C1AA
MNEAHIRIVQNLEAGLIKLENKRLEPLLLMEESIGQITLALLEMKNVVLTEGFESEKCEIHFFKEIKPKVYSQLIYYLRLMKIETFRSALASDGQMCYLSSIIKELEQFYISHTDLYRYYRLNLNYMDKQYFLRNMNKDVKDIEQIHLMLDAQFSAPHDYTWAKFIAHEQLIKHLDLELELVKQGNSNKPLNKYKWLDETSFRWTDAKVALVELIYAIHSARSINEGRTEIKKLVRLFELMFNIELSDAYRAFLDIRGRKIERTRYLDHLKESLINRMDDWDNKDLNNV